MQGASPMSVSGNQIPFFVWWLLLKMGKGSTVVLFFFPEESSIHWQ